MRAVDVRGDVGSEASAGSADVDVALPAYEFWSALLIGAIGLLFLSAMATGGSAGRPAYGSAALAGGLMLGAFVLGVVGLVLTRRNVARMHAVEPRVRRYHEQALYCGNCSRIHFATPELPPGVRSRVAWTVPDYRRELWYACGFAKTPLRIPRAH